MLAEQPLTVLAEAAHPDVSWGKVSFIAASTGDDHAAQSNAQILERHVLTICAPRKGHHLTNKNVKKTAM